MLETSVVADDMLAAAVAAVRDGGERALQEALERLPAPIYVTDAEGWVIYFNSACADFAGRTPRAGEDRWCVTWRLYTEDGDLLPHHQCPMAVAIKERRAVRDVVAIAERPDGTRVLFTPYPTPILDIDGTLAGAVNMLIDVTDRRQSERLAEQAVKCRRLAASISDARTLEILARMAEEYEKKSRALGIG